MKSSSKLIMGATVATVVILAIVLSLILVLLAELYCSLLFRRLQKRKSAGIPTAAGNQPQQLNAPSLSTFYAQGVLQAPRNFLFPAISNTEELLDMEKQVLQPPISTTYSAPFVPVFSRYPWPVEEEKEEVSLPYASTSTGTLDAEQLVYISNPIYNNEGNRIIREVDQIQTPFETPDTSPSRLETADSSPVSSSSSPAVLISTPPLTPLKSIPAQVETCSLSLRDVRSLCMTGSYSNSNNDGISSSWSCSPRTSPSW